MSGKRLSLRLFLEGIEVPVVAAVAQGGDGQPASASIQVIATADVHNLEACTLVHLFYLDLHPDAATTSALQAADSLGYRGLAGDMLEAIGNGYRLLFVGEFIRLGVQRSTSGRSATLQCLDMSSYWDRAKQYYMAGGSEGGTSKVAKAAAFMGAGAVSANGYSSEDSGSATESLVSLLTAKAAATPNADGALAGVIRLLEAIGGVFRGSNKFHGLNDVFSAAELRLRLSQMLGVPHNDDTSKALLNHKTFRQWLKATLSRNKGIVSFRQILEVVLARVYHTHVSVLAPPLRPGRRSTIKVRVPVRKGPKKAADPDVQKRIEDLTALIDAGESEAGSEVFLGKLREAAADRVTTADRYGRIDDTVKPDEKSHLSAATGSDRALTETLINFENEGEGDALEALELAKHTRKLYMQGNGGGFKVVAKEVFLSDRLITNMILPNIYFCAPPRCNVLFPDNYSSLSYSRGFLEEVTRLELSSQKEVELDSLSPDPSTAVKYWAPNIETAAGGLAAAARKGARIVMQHERFTGIIPDFQSVPDITAFQKIDTSQGGRGKIPYMQRVAAFNFFEKRFAPRTMQVEGHFNPNVVPGLPGLVVDQVTPDSVRKTLNITPTQYLGKLANVTHSCSQSGGTTSMQFTHCRTHDERLEYLGPFVNSFWELAGKRSFDLTVDAMTMAAEKAAVEYKGEIGLPLTDALGNPVQVGEPLQDVGSILNATLDVSKGGKSLGKFKVARVLSAVESIDMPEAVVVEAVQNVYTKRQEEVPAEDALFPPWMCPIYANDRIGPDFYQDLLQIGSVCDDVELPGYSPSSGVSVPTASAAQSSGAAAAARDLFRAGDTDGGKAAKSAARTTSVSAAVDELVAEYARLKESGGDFQEFYKAYSWRPVATLRQVLGAHDFDLSTLPTTQPLYVGQMLPEGPSSVVQKAEGFHSRAFGPYDNMEYLDHPATPYPGSVEARKVDPAADPRGKRYRAVLAYVAVLKADRGLRG